VQPVSVLDVASAVLTAVRDDGAVLGNTYTLGGPDVFTYKQVVSPAPPPPREPGQAALVAAPAWCGCPCALFALLSY
jgi:uncharacterized protein YbjT (DUF2867 family)